MSEQDPQAAEQRRIGGWMYIAFWVMLFIFLGILFNHLLDKQRNPNQDVVTHIGSNGQREVTLKRNRMGHYNVTGSINGHTVEFMLDTGATDIAVPASLAGELGLRRLGQMQFNTANGVTTGYITRIQEVRVGDIVLHDLPASITPNMQGDIVLLGMSFLKKINFSQRGDTLILQQ